MSALDAVLAHSEFDMEAALERLFALLRIHSISTDPHYAADCRTCADWLVRDLQSIGFSASARETQGYPIVVGHDRGVPGASALFYGHYDVQPMDPMGLWTRDPFDPSIETQPDGMRVIRARGACAQTPMGPTIQVVPGPNKSFSNFQSDQAICRNFAEQAVRDQARNANLRALGAGALTTALGAGLGGAIGGGSGAGIGAAAGALGGAGLGAVRASNAQNSIQAQYNDAFTQCMFSLGNAVPRMGPMMTQQPARWSTVR